jgi:hypothetical protein
MGIESHFDLWNRFLLSWLLQGSGAEAAVLGGVDIYIKSGYRVDPYFQLPMSGSIDGGEKYGSF